MVAGNRLRLAWSYSASLHERATVQSLAECVLGHLQALIEHCRSERGPVFTPSDFPQAGIDQKALDSLLARVKNRRRAAPPAQRSSESPES